MTVIEARRIAREYYDMSNPTEDDRFLFVEAMQFLIRETKNSNAMLDLGSYYYEDKRFANCAVDRTVLRSKTDAERSERTP